MERETCITRIHGDDHVGVYTSETKFINYINKMKEKYPDEVKINVVNPDGSLCADMPYEWIRMPSPPKRMNLTDEQKEERRLRLLSIKKQG